MTPTSSGRTKAAQEERLETPRLLLRPIRHEDVARCLEIHLAGGGGDGRDHEADFREEVEHWAEHGFGPWVALERAGEEIVGTIDVNYAGRGIDGVEPEEIEVGWMIEPVRRGRGLATEGARAACADAFARLGVSAVVAYVRPDNAPSLRVAEKLGMTFEGNGRSRDGEHVLIYRLRP